MNDSRQTSDERKDDKKPNAGAGNTQTSTPDQGEESRETNAGNIRGKRIHRRT